MQSSHVQGGFGIIVPCAEDSCRVWKILAIEKTPVKQARSEFEIMNSLSHRNIVRAHAFVVEETRTCILMDYAGVDILNGPFPDQSEVNGIFIQILAAVMHMHHARVAHRDLKLENVMLDASGLVRVTDFGLSIVISTENLGQSVCEIPLGSRAYAAPEMWHGPYDPFKCDVWSLGIILYALWFQRIPFSDAYKAPLFGRWRGFARLGNTPMQAFAKLGNLSDPPDWLRERIDEMLCLCEEERVSLL